MNIRRLDPVTDDSLLRIAFSWDANVPSWYRDSDAICRPTIDDYLKMAREDTQVDVGVFDPDFIGLITVDYKTKGIVEVRLSAKRGASLEVITKAAYQIRHQLFSLGMRAGVVWIAKRNRPVIKLCAMIGFVQDGRTLIRGTYRKIDKPITLVRMITTREQWLDEQRIAA